VILMQNKQSVINYIYYYHLFKYAI